MLHITGRQTDDILGYIPLGDFWNDRHRKSLKDTIETFDFVTFGDKRYSEHLAKMNRIIIPDEDGTYGEFVINNTYKYRNRETLVIEVFSSASYLLLKKAKVIRPQRLEGITAEQGLEFALTGTEWKVGIVESGAERTFNIEDITNPYAFIKQMATSYELEPRFRVEEDGNKVVARYVDLLDRVGEWRGREVVFGEDLKGIERREDNSKIVTALIGLGPEREDGTRMEVIVEDEEALQRWGKPHPDTGELMHWIEVYEPQFSTENPSEDRLRTLTENELKKRVNSIVEYSGDVMDLEKVPGLENKVIRYGDTIKIKDTGYNPPLYLEARIHTQDRSISNPSDKRVILGDYIEYTEEEVNAIWKNLQREIEERLSRFAIVSIVASSGTVFKNGIGQTKLRANVFQNGKEVDQYGNIYLYTWQKLDKNGNSLGYTTGKEITVNAQDVDEKITYVVTVGREGVDMSSDVITVTNVFDGEDGEQGPPGPPGKDGYTPIKGVDYFDGKDGQDGKSSYLWVRYSTNPDGDPMSTSPENAIYIGIATTNTPSAPSSPSDYRWSLIKGQDGIPGEPGEDGKTSYLHIKYSNDGGKTFTGNNGEDPGEWIGTYVDFNPADSNNPADYTWNKVKGEKGDKGDRGPQGPQGPAGTSVSSITEYYLATNQSSGVTTGTTGWTTTMQQMTPQKRYLWNYERINFSDGTHQNTNPVIIGVYGDEGEEGRSIVGITEYYLASSASSGVTRSTSGWTTSMQVTTPEKKYLWNYEKITWNKAPLETYTDPVIIGVHGEEGPKGEDGKTFYTWIKYADTPTSGMSDNPEGKEYIGIAYNKETPTPSTNYADYVWSKFKGEQGVPGPPGEDGQPTYTWVKYADDENGNGMSDSPDGKLYIGLAFNKTTPEESNNPADYTWSLMPQNIEIGGRNLLLGTSKDEIEFSFSDYNGPAHRVTDDKFEEILKGGNYTASVEITELDAVDTNLALMISFRNSTGAAIRQIVSPMSLSGKQTGRIVFTAKLAPLALDSGVAYIEVHLRNLSPGGSSKGKYREMKLEKGNKATDWTPAPEDVQEQIDEAKQDAQNAQMTADGKNTVFYQSTTPSTSGRKVGDVWFHTGQGYRMYRFTGSSWSATQFGSDAIANLSITNAKIANGTIESAKISYVDAGKITTGTLDALKVNVINLNASNIKSGTLKAIDIEGVTIKGSTFTTTGTEGTVSISTDTILQRKDDGPSGYSQTTIRSGQIEQITNYGGNSHDIISIGAARIRITSYQSVVTLDYRGLTLEDGSNTANISIDSDRTLRIDDIVHTDTFIGYKWQSPYNSTIYQEWSNYTWKLNLASQQVLFADRDSDWARFKIGNVFLKGTDRSKTGNILEIRNNSDNGWSEAKALKFTTMSNAEYKKNIEDYPHEALPQVLDTPVKYYNYLEDIDDVDRKSVGLIVQDAPVDIIDIRGDGIDIYGMTSLLWKAVQELTERVKELERNKVQ